MVFGIVVIHKSNLTFLLTFQKSISKTHMNRISTMTMIVPCITCIFIRPCMVRYSIAFGCIIFEYNGTCGGYLFEIAIVRWCTAMS